MSRKNASRFRIWAVVTKCRNENGNLTTSFGGPEKARHFLGSASCEDARLQSCDTIGRLVPEEARFNAELGPRKVPRRESRPLKPAASPECRHGGSGRAPGPGFFPGVPVLGCVDPDVNFEFCSGNGAHDEEARSTLARA